MDSHRDLFFGTDWSLLARAKAGDEGALNAVCLSYRSPLVVWLRCRGEKPEDAEDGVQGFFEHLLRHDFLRGVAREKGRFRTFLLAAFQNYLSDQRKRAGAAKRGGGHIPESLEATNAEGQPLHSPASTFPTPDKEYDRAWAAMILASALQRLSAQCARTGHAALCAELEPALFADADAPAYAQIAHKLGMTEAAVKMAALRIRAELRFLIRHEVLETVASVDDFKEELRYFLSMFDKASPAM